MIKAKTPLPRLSGFPGGLTNRKRMGKRWEKDGIYGIV